MFRWFLMITQKRVAVWLVLFLTLLSGCSALTGNSKKVLNVSYTTNPDNLQVKGNIIVSYRSFGGTKGRWYHELSDFRFVSKKVESQFRANKGYFRCYQKELFSEKKRFVLPEGKILSSHAGYNTLGGWYCGYNWNPRPGDYASLVDKYRENKYGEKLVDSKRAGQSFWDVATPGITKGLSQSAADINADLARERREAERKRDQQSWASQNSVSKGSESKSDSNNNSSGDSSYKKKSAGGAGGYTTYIVAECTYEDTNKKSFYYFSSNAVATSGAGNENKVSDKARHVIFSRYSQLSLSPALLRCSSSVVASKAIHTNAGTDVVGRAKQKSDSIYKKWVAAVEHRKEMAQRYNQNIRSEAYKITL